MKKTVSKIQEIAIIRWNLRKSIRVPSKFRDGLSDVFEVVFGAMCEGNYEKQQMKSCIVFITPLFVTFCNPSKTSIDFPID